MRFVLSVTRKACYRQTRFSRNAQPFLPQGRSSSAEGQARGPAQFHLANYGGKRYEPGPITNLTALMKARASSVKLSEFPHISARSPESLLPSLVSTVANREDIPFRKRDQRVLAAQNKGAPDHMGMSWNSFWDCCARFECVCQKSWPIGQGVGG